MGSESTSTTGGRNEISRRRVVAGAAWTVPAVIVAGAAPAMAASKCLTASFGGESCKFPGGGQNNFGYRLQICFTNDCDVAATILVKSIKSNATQSPTVQINQTLTLPAHSPQQCLPDLVIYCSQSSANFLNITFTVNGGADQVAQLPSPPTPCTGPDLCNP